MNKLSNLFTNNVLQKLKELGLSQADLARASGMSPQHLGAYLSGKSEPGIAKVGQIADALGCSPADLIRSSILDPNAAVDRKQDEVRDHSPQPQALTLPDIRSVLREELHSVFSPQEREVLRMFAEMNSEDRLSLLEHMSTILRSYSSVANSPAKRSKAVKN